MQAVPEEQDHQLPPHSKLCALQMQEGHVCSPVVSSVTNNRIGCHRCIINKFRDCSLYQKCERCKYSGDECIPHFPYDELDSGYPRFLIGCIGPVAKRTAIHHALSESAMKISIIGRPTIPKSTRRETKSRIGATWRRCLCRH
jgi:hypothetical protein